MSARCGICLKITRNYKQRLRLVTSDAEAKIQYGYYSLHNKDLNRNLLNTKVHQKCYRKYQDRWYNQSIRNNKLSNVSTAVEDEVILVDDENDVPEENSSLSIHNIDDCNENHGEQDDHVSSCKSLFSARNISNESTFQKNQSALSDISNIDYSSRNEISCNTPVRNSDTEDSSFNNINSEDSIDDNEVMSLENLSINSNFHIIQDADKHKTTVTSDVVDEESSSSKDYHGLTSIIEPANGIRIPLHLKHQTSTPKVITSKNVNYKHHHQRSDSTVRCDILRKELEVKYPNHYHFETVNKRDGTYVALNDISHYSRAAIHMNEALRDHAMSFYHDFEPFIDHSLTPHLFAYGFIKSYFNRLGTCNLPLYSGFMAIHLPHNNRSRHKVTFMTPINEDPNKIETTKECINQMKKLLLDSGLQNDAILIVDERIFRLCIEVKDEDSSNFDGIFLYPGDFHMMKCAMKVIWEVLEESGIDNLMGLLYKGATHRAVLSVAHFNKSLRAIKLLYTALLILIHTEFITTLSLSMVEEIEKLMNRMPLDAPDVEESKAWYASVLDYFSNVKLQDTFDSWIKINCEKNLKFRFWTFVLFDLITPLIKLYTALRTSNFSARNAAVCELAELFFATNHRQYARLTARHISDLRVCPQHLLDRLSKSFAVVRTNRNFSSIALDQTIEVTINKMGKGHGGITGRCSMKSIDIWSKSYTFRSLLSTVASELAGIESNVNSMESHVECSQTRMESDHVDLQIILDKIIDEKLFSSDTNDVIQIFTGKVIHPDIIESNCMSRITGAEILKKFIHERLVNCSTPLSVTLNASSLLRIRDNDTYESSRSNVKKSSRRKSTIDIKKVDAEIRRILLLSQYRPIDLESVFSHELSTIPISLCSLEDVNMLNQQSKSKDTFEFLKQQFPTAIYSTNIPTTNQPKALVIDGSSLLHIYPRKGSNAFQYALYLLIEHILPYFVDYLRIDIIFDSPKSRDSKSFTNRYTNSGNVQPKYNNIMRNSILPTGKAFQNFVISNRAIFAASIIESWKETEATNQIPSGCVLIVAGPDEKAFKLEKDEQPEDLIELEIKSIDTDVIILCIYHASLCGLRSLLVDATLPKKQLKVIDCKFIHDELIDRYGVNPLIFLIVYALSGCDTCSFTRNVSKRTFMQVMFDTPNDFNGLQKLTTLPTSKDDIIAAERLFVRCFSSNRRRRQSTSTASSSNNLSQIDVKDVSINQLRAIIAMVCLKKNATTIATSLPPTQDSLFYHCLRTSRQVQIWIQAPDSYIKYPDLQESGFKIIDGRVQIQWTSKLPFSNDRQLTCCGKHKGKCIRCVCIVNQLPCTIFCQCDFDCPNRALNQTSTTNSQISIRPTKEKKDTFTLNSRLTTSAFDYEYISEEESSDQSSGSTDYCSIDDMDEVSDG
ncbi:unnamed protein product, partial [Rotaria sp. Silwood2]